MLRRSNRAVWTACMVAAMVIGTQTAAQANPFPNNGDSTFADNGLHTYCYTSGFTTDPSVASYAMDVLGDTTDMEDHFPTTPATCTYMETDVWWFESDLPASTRGVRDCWLESPNGICTSSDIDLDYAQLDLGGTLIWEDRRKTAVHEVGHSVGLGHDASSTMMSGPVPDASVTYRRYSAHDIAHINGRY